MLWNQSRLGAFEVVPKITYLFFAGWVLIFGMVVESVGSAPIAKTLKKDDWKGVNMSDKPFVESQSGLFEGLWANDLKSVRVFKGIPYAEPPIGDLRFRPPVPKAPIKTRFLAQNDASPCWQSQGNDGFVWSLGSLFAHLSGMLRARLPCNGDRVVKGQALVLRLCWLATTRTPIPRKRACLKVRALRSRSVAIRTEPALFDGAH